MKFKRLIPLMVLVLAVSGCGKKSADADTTETTTETATETVSEESTTAVTTTQTTTSAATTQAATEAAQPATAPAVKTAVVPAPPAPAPEPAPEVKAPEAGTLGVTLKHANILLNTAMSEASKILGSTTDYSEAPSCNYDGLDKVFTYDKVNIYTYPHPSGDIINEIEINDEAIMTDKGIAPIGKTIDEVKAVYGEPTEVEGVTYKYTDGNCYTYFYAENGVVTYWGVAMEE